MVVGIWNAVNGYVRHNFSFSSICNKANLAQQQKPIPNNPRIKRQILSKQGNSNIGELGYTPMHPMQWERVSPFHDIKVYSGRFTI